MSWAWAGGRIDIRPHADGYLPVALTGGRIAHQINDHQVYLICGECRQDVLIQRRDGVPLTASDISEALHTWVHHCPEEP